MVAEEWLVRRFLQDGVGGQNFRRSDLVGSARSSRKICLGFLMPKITVIFSVLYIAVGLGAFFLTGAVHKTALIPAYLGAVLLSDTQGSNYYNGGSGIDTFVLGAGDDFVEAGEVS